MTIAQCRFCFSCLAMYYPLFLAASFVVDAVPNLFRRAVLGHSLVKFEISSRGFSTQSIAPGSDIPVNRTAVSDSAIVASLLIGLWIVPQRWRPLLGLFAAIAATQSGFFTWFFFRRLPPPGQWHQLVFLPLLLVGLWFHVRAICAAWWMRLIAVTLVFALPQATIQLSTIGRMPRGGFAVAFGFFALPALAAGTLAVFATWKAQHPHTDLFASWKAAVSGILLTALAATGLTAKGRMDRAAELETRAAASRKAESVPVKDHGRVFFQKGVNFTSEGWARYGTEQSIRTLRAVHARGVDSIALVPYGWGPAKSPEVRFGNPNMEPDDGIAILTGVAHELGMKVMLKPQLWVQPGGFPGAVEMPDEQTARQWFQQYAGFTEYYARLAQKLHVDLFCVGTEFVHMSKYTDEWRKQITLARTLYSGPIVYAATQGPEFENLAFWDDLDYIGLNNYYPLPDDFSTADLVRKVEAVQSKYNKPVLLTEAGYVSMEWPNRAPWDESPRRIDLDHQAKGYEAIYRAFWHKPWFAGIYWWRVGSNGEGGPADGHHTPWGKPAMDVVSRYYRSVPPNHQR
jgi:hypothetical protein